MQTRWMRGVIVALVVADIGLVGFAGVPETRAASSFADPAFQTQWKTDEALAPNFWGPLANAHQSMMEPWKEAPNGHRTVQYFDKGRMELGSGGVTAGLLATELMTGKVQTGANSFDPKPAPAIPIAGDAENPGPTFAAFTGPAAPLLTATTTKVSSDPNPSGITTALATDGTITTFMPGADYGPASLSDFDSATKHNVARAFATYRDKVGLPNIGYAISEPFWATILVGGQHMAVLVQAFERRVLTYTPQNPPGFEVEMGNIGAQYYRWRYESAGAATTATGMITATATGAATGTTNAATINATAAAATNIALTAFPGRLLLPTPTMPAILGTPLSSAAAAAANGVSFLNPPATVSRGSTATATVSAPVGAYCTITVTYTNGPSRVDGLTDKTVDSSGKVSWSWFVGPGNAPGPAPIDVTCSINGKAYVVSATTTVTA